HLLNRFTPDEDPSLDDHNHRLLRDAIACDCSLEFEHTSDCPEFSHEEIADAVERQHDGKSPGEDGLSANILRMAYRHASDVFDRLYNCCLKYRCFPLWFKSSIVKAIPKPSSTDLQNPKSWRPISLLSVPGK